MIGAIGPGNLSQYNIIDNTVSYFIYQSLPCSGGCDLCGVDGTKTNFMTNPDGKFSSEFLKNGEEQRCFDAQLGALTGGNGVSQEQCAAIRESAREPCGCKNPNPNPVAEEPKSGAHSLRTKPTSTTGVVLLTLAAASLAPMLLG